MFCNIFTTLSALALLQLTAAIQGSLAEGTYISDCGQDGLPSNFQYKFRIIQGHTDGHPTNADIDEIEYGWNQCPTTSLAGLEDIITRENDYTGALYQNQHLAFYIQNEFAYNHDIPEGMVKNFFAFARNHLGAYVHCKVVSCGSVVMHGNDMESGWMHLVMRNIVTLKDLDPAPGEKWIPNPDVSGGGQTQSFWKDGQCVPRIVQSSIQPSNPTSIVAIAPM